MSGDDPQFTSRQLNVFIHVAETGSFREASERLNISQPSVSQQIRALERGLGVALFTRPRGSRPRLTQEGQIFLQTAIALQGELMSLSQVQSAPLNSTVNVAIGPALLPHVQNQLPQIIAHHPTVDVEFFRMPSIDQALIDMDNGEIDVALYTSPTLPPKRVDHSLIRTVKLGLFAPAGTTLDMVVGENASFPVVLPFEHAWMTAFIAQKMKQRGIGASNVVGRTQYPDILVRLMVDRGAITAISSDLLQPYVEDGTLTCLIPDLGTLYRLAVYSNRPFSPAQRMFLDTLIDIVGRIGEPPEEALAGRP